MKVDDSLTANDREKAVGGWGEPESNNLVYTKRPNDMYANRNYETTPQQVPLYVYPIILDV